MDALFELCARWPLGLANLSRLELFDSLRPTTESGEAFRNLIHALGVV